MNFFRPFNIIRIILFIIISITLGACQNRESNTIRIGVLQGPSAISFAKMMENPMVVGGKKVEIIIKNDPQQIQSLMLKNELDFAILPTVMAANLYNKNLPYQMMACPVWGTLYLVSRDKNVQSFGQIAGREVAVFGQGATPDILLRNKIKNEGIDNVVFNYAFNSNNDLALAILNSKVQLAVLSEPMVSLVLSKDKDVSIVTAIDCEEYMLNMFKDIFVQTAFLVNTNFANNHPLILKEINEQYIRSCNFINEEPTLAAELVVKLGLLPDIDIAAKSLPLCNIRYVSAFAIERELSLYLNIFLKQNPETIGGKIPDKGFVFKNF